MSALSEIDGRSIAAKATSQQAETIPPEIVAAVKLEVNSLFWKWYREHENNHVVTVHLFWFVEKEIRVSDIHDVFVILFGPEGADQSQPQPPTTTAPSLPDPADAS